MHLAIERCRLYPYIVICKYQNLLNVDCKYENFFNVDSVTFFMLFLLSFPDFFLETTKLFFNKCIFIESIVLIAKIEWFNVFFLNIEYISGTR